jgi:hypothetical protein
VKKTAWTIVYNNWVCSNASHEAGYYDHYYVEPDAARAVVTVIEGVDSKANKAILGF